jgi:hypothetical protein
LPIAGPDILDARRTLSVGGRQYDYFSLAAAAVGIGDLVTPAAVAEGAA